MSEDLRMKRANNKLCPQGWAWLIGDCDVCDNCAECPMDEAPSLASDSKRTVQP